MTLRPNLPNPTPNTWVSTPNVCNAVDTEWQLYTHNLFSLLFFSSEPPVLGAHLLLQWPSVCRSGEEAGLGLRSHCHTGACNDHQPR